MKLTKKQLKEIIREELQPLNERGPIYSNISNKWDGDEKKAALDLILMAQEYMEAGMGEELDKIIVAIEKKALPAMKKKRKFNIPNY
jgi:hypothetical protein